MKKYISPWLLLFLFAIPCFAQKPDISKFTYLETVSMAGVEKIVLIDLTTNTRKGDEVKFQAVLGNYMGQDGDLAVVDEDNYILSDFIGNCSTKTLAYVRNRGAINGKLFDFKTEPVLKPAVLGSPGRDVLERVCRGEGVSV